MDFGFYLFLFRLESALYQKQFLFALIVTMIMNVQKTDSVEIVIDSVNKIIDILEADPLQQQPHSHIRLWCRGQNNIQWELIPKLYRPDFNPINEKDRSDLESHLTREFKSLAGANLSGQESDSDLYFLQQHYGQRTRLLDWTNNPMVALWFAVEGKDNANLDGAFYTMDVYQMKHLRKNFGIAIPNEPDFIDSIKNIVSYGTQGKFPNKIFPIRPDHKIQRIKHQQSFFTFHVPENKILTEENNTTLTRYKVPSDFKKQIKKTLKLMGIDSYFVFGGLENLVNELDESYITRWQK